MLGLSRRTVLGAGAAVAAIPFADWWPSRAATSVTKRCSAFSPEGKKALESYAVAVGKMKQLSASDPTDPLGWTYQYKMHLFPDNGFELLEAGGLAAWRKGQEDELDTFFGPASPTNKKRAEAILVWGKCPHGSLNFMPWHRMYLFFFERAVKKLSGDADFALPYWGYMDGEPSRVLPPEFLVAGSPLLHHRSGAISGGGVMDESGFAGGFWDDDDFSFFSSSVEGSPHADVHNDVGEGGLDMSSLFRSPRDPVFWLHHCEIDRIWESALRANFKPPTGEWGNQKFNFYDEERALIEIKSSDVLTISNIAEWGGYDYDKVLERPNAPAAVMAMSAQAETAQVRSAVASATSVAIRAGSQTVALNASTSASVAAAGASDGPARTRLELSNVTLDKRAVANVGLYLNAPPEASGEALQKYLVGTLSTFAILPGVSASDHSAHGGAGPAPVRSYDVTRLVATLKGEGKWSGQPQLTIKEITGSLGDATLEVGKIDVVEIRRSAASPK